MFLKPSQGLVFNSQKCCYTFVNWYYHTFVDWYKCPSIIKRPKLRSLPSAARAVKIFGGYIKLCLATYNFLDRNDSELRTTLIELNAIAKPAIVGLREMPKLG